MGLAVWVNAFQFGLIVEEIFGDFWLVLKKIHSSIWCYSLFWCKFFMLLADGGGR
jgi:hypothetical protein